MRDSQYVKVDLKQNLYNAGDNADFFYFLLRG